MEDPWADLEGSSAPLGSSSHGDDNNTEPASATAPSSTTTSAATATAPTTTSNRPSRLTPRRLVAQPTRLQAVEDDPLGPLGAPPAHDAALTSPPLGGAAGKAGGPPVPPSKEQLPLRTTMPSSAAAAGKRAVAGPPDPHRIDDDNDNDDDGRLFGGDRPRQPPPVQAALPSPMRSTVPPSVSVEQAAKPSFHITVGDPHKVGDLATSHIVYSVRTKVCYSMKSPVAT